MFKLEFGPDIINEVMSECLPDEGNTAGEFCVFIGCDLKYKTLCDETYKLPNKKTFEDAYQSNKNGLQVFPETNKGQIKNQEKRFK